MPVMSKLALIFLLIMVLGTAAHASEQLQDTMPAADINAIQPESAEDADGSRTDPTQSGKAVVEYQNSIKNLQKLHGAFYDQISQELVGMGLAYRNLGLDKEAIDAFNRSLHINRINHGLYDDSQLPILELIIQTNTALADWQALDQNYHYLYWVTRRIYGSDDPRLLPVIDRVGRWHLHAYSLADDQQPFEHLITADLLFQDAVRIIEENYGPDDPRLVDPLYGLVMSNYQIASHASATVMYDDLRYNSVNSGFMDDTREEVQARLDLIGDSYRDGKKAMEKIVNIYDKNTDLPTDEHGMALILLGDWYLLFDRRKSAMEAYANAYRKLQESGMQQTDINDLFDHPRSLPALQLPTEYQAKQAASPGEKGEYVIARFDVSKTGLASNIEIVEASPADDIVLMRHAKASIRATRFRPKLENGQPVATTGVNIKYVNQE